MKTSATNRKLRVLLTAIGAERQTLIPRPDFQRRLVWTNKDKLSFIQTVLEGYPFPEIYIASGSVDPDTGEGTEMLVDGQQRITTLYQYFKAATALRLDSKTTPYANLSSEQKVAFLEYEVVVRDLGQMRLEDIKTVFQRINATNYSLNAMEIHNSRFGGEFKQAAQWISEQPFFGKHDVFSAADVRRMQDVRFSLTLLVTAMSTYFNRDESLETYLENFNDEFDESDSIKQEFVKLFDFMDACRFSAESRVWKKADLFTIIIELHRAIFKKQAQIFPANVGASLAEFYSQVDLVSSAPESETNAGRYYKAALQASNDRSNRITRGEIIQSILESSTKQDRFTLTS